MHVVTSLHEENFMQEVQVLSQFAMCLDLAKKDGSCNTLTLKKFSNDDFVYELMYRIHTKKFYDRVFWSLPFCGRSCIEWVTQKELRNTFV